MKKHNTIINICIVAILFAFATDASAASRESFAFIGWNGGLNIGTGLDDSSDTEKGGSLYGLDAKIVWDKNADLIAGISYSSFRTKITDNPYIGGESKIDMKGYVGEIMIPLNGRIQDTFTYLLLAGGRMYEEFTKTAYRSNFTTSGTYYGTTYSTTYQSQTCDLVGMGVGFMAIPDTNGNFGVGFEFKYLSKIDNKIPETEGELLQFNILLGLMF